MMVCLLHISLLWSLCGAQLSDISQPASFQTVELGHTVTITCCIASAVRTRVWYKVTTGRRLQLVASTDTFYNRTTFREQSHHYTVKFDRLSSHLSISAATWDDAGTYYCGVINLNDVKFGSGTFLIIKGANMISDSVFQPGDSVTLSCSVHTGHCAAEHTRVMWLKNSHHSAPQMIYSSGNDNHTCQRTESGETTCVYKLPMSNLSSDDAGTYYCVVTSCGHSQSGNGTRINIHSNMDLRLDFPSTLEVFVVVTVTLGFLLALLMCMIMKKNCFHCTGNWYCWYLYCVFIEQSTTYLEGFSLFLILQLTPQPLQRVIKMKIMSNTVL
ncbi:signal-regulatory protein beta-2 isoform X5 [Dicentrarchus labrax]|uniref:signal-regulatory protein beta-2 isoform X5 n=1 Tax=Dicentrarchus labrax TaxID=13489 RepID=UPI0021F65458|nr:signal-regulatory protein beta-2 isoform X5 [Dicentrarchus labrax]